MNQQDNIETNNQSSIIIEDLAAQSADEIKGGLLLPAVQKVREAASRASVGGGKVSMNDFNIGI